ncbi:PEP-CTERM sorting domain-containing protein [Pseudoduganella albidiflava]|uniref:Ice-binding protein C-terminal domain-containing protein n=2 Tax=Pseudoduganella albidiflava TaxID=321983 RepID=A0AA87XXK4_9BURK|nr:PEP-CTERM sorting domain-containing protein [Pseudoduganella albidiflava]GGY46574.1 hypothetical protein GCM10007387_30890 [Pseudoduganella albidiflava]
MLNKNKVTLALASAMFAGSAFAAPVVLDFEGIGTQAQILDFYNGGTDSEGNSGTNYGISFGPDALGLVDEDAGGTGNIANEPSGETVMFFLTGSAILNNAAGFDTGFSFYYSAAYSASVDVYSGLNATGTLLGTIHLSAQHTSNCVGDPYGQYCNYTAAGLSFDGEARSIDFSGTANYVVFDNITFGAATPPPPVPEPGTYAMLGLGLAGMAAYRRLANRKA